MTGDNNVVSGCVTPPPVGPCPSCPRVAPCPSCYAHWSLQPYTPLLSSSSDYIFKASSTIPAFTFDFPFSMSLRLTENSLFFDFWDPLNQSLWSDLVSYQWTMEHGNRDGNRPNGSNKAKTYFCSPNCFSNPNAHSTQPISKNQSHVALNIPNLSAYLRPIAHAVPFFTTNSASKYWLYARMLLPTQLSKEESLSFKNFSSAFKNSQEK